MKKLLAFVTLCLLLLMSGCVGADAPKTISTPQQAASNTVQANSSANASQQKSAAQSAKLTMEVAGKPVTIKLADNAATKRLISKLPADLEFKDFNNTEKITYLPNKINVDGVPKGHAPKAGDMCIYVPWGNICIFYHDYKYSSDLVYLGSVEQGLDMLSVQSNNFKVTLSVAK